MDRILDRLGAALAGRYEVERELGQGAMAVVYLARDLRHERFVAIKVLRPELSPALGAERFLREIRLAARLQHPHILPLYDSGEAAGLLYYVMPYVEGESLRQRLEREAQLPLDDAVRIAAEVADALDYAHRRDVVHRDVKPENILLSGDHALVADFGIARAIDAAGGLKLTETGMAVGTPVYMSPEQAMAASRIDGRADQYALACVLYEMLAGQPPFTGPTAQAVMARHSVDAVPPLRTLRDVSPALEAALIRALAKAPGDRWPSAGAFEAALAGARAALLPTRRVRARVVLTVAIGLLALGAGAAVAVKNRLSRRTHAPSIAVVPLRNLGHDSEAYFAEGMTQELTSALVRIEGLLVRPFTTVAVEATKGGDPLAVGRRLRADYVLTGSVRRSRQTIGVTVELIRVQDGAAVWSPRRFDGTAVVDIFETQDSIARQLVGDLRIRLPGTTMASVPRGRRGSSDPEAYNLYLQGLHFEWKLNVGTLLRAEELFSHALARDPGFADALVALAETRRWLLEIAPFGVRPDRPPIDSLLRAALALDSTNAAAYRVIALLSLQNCDSVAVERAFQNALRYGPASAETWVFYAQFLNSLGRHREALAAAWRAVDLDPVSPFVAGNLSYRYVHLGEFEHAIAEGRRAVSLDSAHFVPRSVLGIALGFAGHYREGIAELLMGRRLGGGTHGYTLGALGYLYAVSGRPDLAREVAREIDEIVRRQGRVRTTYGISPAHVAWVHAGLGDADSTAFWLERAYPPGDGRRVIEAHEPAFARLRMNPRFAAVLGRIGCASPLAAR